MNSEDWLFQNKEASPEQKAKHREIQLMYSECFASPVGKKVLEHLKSITVDQPVLMGYGSDGSNTAIMMAGREGANGLYRVIKNLVKHGGSDNE